MAMRDIYFFFLFFTPNPLTLLDKLSTLKHA